MIVSEAGSGGWRETAHLLDSLRTAERPLRSIGELEGGRSQARVESPVAFSRSRIFTEAEPLRRASTHRDG